MATMRTFLLAAICVATCLANSTEIIPIESPNECFGDDGSCFYYENKLKQNWHDAEAACRQSGGHLASLTSKEETSKFLDWTKELLFSEDKAWIGLNSVGLDGSFQWVDGRLVDYTNWESAKTAYAQHVCVYVTQTGSWDVADCKERHVAICRSTPATSVTTPMTTPSSNGTTPFQGYCSKGSFTFGEEEEKCYQLFGNKLSWSDAKKACTSNGQELVSIHNMHEQEFLTALLGKMNTSVWIGLKKSPPEEMYQWVDSSEFDFSNWAPRQPSDQQMCVEMLANPKQGGKWNDRSCEQKQGFICQKNRDPTISTTIAPSTKCDTANATFYPYLDSCYNVFFNESLTWSQAQAHCKQYEGGSLTSITNAQELAFLSLLRRYNHQNDLWIGLSADNATPGLFKWSDDWPVLISEWEYGEPVLSKDSNRSCVALTIDNKWAVKNCEEKTDFICKFTKVKPPPLPQPHGKCPNPEKTEVEWTNIGADHCYYVNQNALRSWGEASELCTQLYPGARLASFHWQDELTKLKSITNFNQSLWIGLAQGQNGFQWSDESPVNFISWETDPVHDSNCVALKGLSTKWNSFDCNANLGFICMVDKEETTTTSEITTVTEYPRVCGTPGSGWKYFEDNCYKVYSTWDKSFSWDSADDFCKGQKSKLASIHSEEENAFINKQITNSMMFASDSDYWLGMFRPRSHESFYWTDDSLVDFTKVPFINSTEERQCVSIHQKTGSWNQTSCSNENGLVCKMPYKPTVVTTTPMPGTSTEYPGYCDVDWTRLGNKCVKIFDDEPLNWTTARETCKQKYDDLFAIHNKHEEMVITSLLENYNRSLWIGLRRIMQEQFEWSDGTEMDFAYWGAGEPSGNQEKCVSLETSVVRAGKWRNSMCSEKRGYICQNFPSKTVTTPTPEYDNRTEDGFVKYGSADYKFELNVTKASNWREAETACKHFGGHLVSINSPYEQAFIYTQLDSVTDIEGLWIGLADLGENGIFNWTDNWPIFFTDWASDEPRHPSHNTRCVYLDLKTEEWRSDDCLEPRDYICKVTDEKPPPIPEVNNGTCPEHLKNWTDVGTNYCYYISPSADKDLALTWSEASLYCNQRGAKLASIHSHQELDMLVPYFRDATRAMWIGMLRKYYGGFEWDDNTALNFVHWGADYPTEKTEKNCVSMSQYNIGWRDDDCKSKFGFICKVMKEVPMPTTTVPPTTTNTSDTTVTQPGSSTNGTDTTVTEPGSSTNGTDTTVTEPGSSTNGTESTVTETGSSTNGTESSSSSATTGNEPGPEKNTGLGGGAIAGIVIGCLVAVVLVAGGAFFYMKRHRPEEELLINDHSSP